MELNGNLMTQWFNYSVRKHVMLTWIIIKCHDGDIAVSRIVRVIRQPRGNMLLIGIGGSGRQSLTRLASFICDYDTFQIEVSKQYRRLEFREGK